MSEIEIYKPNDSARIEAMQVNGYDDLRAALAWAGNSLRQVSPKLVEVHTLEGWVELSLNSFLIKGTSGEFYPCDPDIFRARWVRDDA